MWGKKKGTTKCDKSTVTCDIGIAQCEDGTIKMWEKIRELPNVTKVQLHVMLVLYNVRIVPSNVMFWSPGITGCLLVGTVPPKKKGGYTRITHIYIYI